MLTSTARRLPQLIIGLAVFGSGLGLVVRGSNGQGSWTVFHEGLSIRTPLSIGTATILTGAVLLVVVIMMRVKIGIGTILNILIIGPSTDLTLWLVEEPESAVVRGAFTIASPLVVGLGSSLYLGVQLGPGTRDGVMTGLHDRGMSIRAARSGIEAAAFGCGFLLGGTVGWGTIWWLVAIGPTVQWMLPWFDRGPRMAG